MENLVHSKLSKKSKKKKRKILFVFMSDGIRFQAEMILNKFYICPWAMILLYFSELGHLF